MKKIIYLLLCFLATNVAFSQSGTIKVNNVANVNTHSARLDKTIKAYSVRIFFDNSQDARSGSEKAKKKFKELYPDTYVFDEYTAPYFKVTAGKFLTHEEAIILWGNILSEFPNAFVVNNYLPLSEFTNSKVLKEQIDYSRYEEIGNTPVVPDDDDDDDNDVNVDCLQ
ncbi:MAG: hypothetical protein R3Y51_06590 [Rikenellaceae bacterium]